MKHALVLNMIKCLGCNRMLISAHDHDFRMCECGTAVDGGRSYRRRLARDLNLIEERSIYLIDGMLKEYADIQEKDKLS